MGTGLLGSKDMRETLFQWFGFGSQALQLPIIMINLFELVLVEVMLVVGFKDGVVDDVAERSKMKEGERPGIHNQFRNAYPIKS